MTAANLDHLLKAIDADNRMADEAQDLAMEEKRL